MSERKFYWLKLKRDFFKRHDIRIVEGMPNGTDYVLLYMKMLCESVDHEGRLRFSEEIPYTNQMLSTIFNTPVDIVDKAFEVFTSLNMLVIEDDGTLYLPEVDSITGYESAWAEKKRKQRGQLGDNVPQMSPECPQSVPDLSDKSKRKSKSKSKSYMQTTYDFNELEKITEGEKV